jgi:hypothetical protein
MLLKISSFCTLHKSPVSTGFAEQITPILRILCYNGSLVTWIAYIPFTTYWEFYTTRTAYKKTPRPVVLLSVFIAAGTCLPSRCLATVEDTHTETQTDGRDLWSTPLRMLRCHDIHTESHKDWFRHSKYVAGRGDSQTARWFYKPTFIWVG